MSTPAASHLVVICVCVNNALLLATLRLLQRSLPGLAVWSTGIKPVDFTAGLQLDKERGRILVDDMLRVPALEGVYALGDCAAAKDKALAPLAQVSEYTQAMILSQRCTGLRVFLHFVLVQAGCGSC
jgi:NAD(P)H-nitrite reductase large subunit